MIIQFDGGTNPNPGKMYGSYAISIDGTEIISITEDYEHGTNNVAEFTALYRGLVRAVALVESMDTMLGRVDLEVLTDSTTVRNRLMNPNNFRGLKNKTNPGSRRMAFWTEKCEPMSQRFHSFKVTWNPRQANVDKFGH